MPLLVCLKKMIIKTMRDGNHALWIMDNNEY